MHKSILAVGRHVTAEIKAWSPVQYLFDNAIAALVTYAWSHRPNVSDAELAFVFAVSLILGAPFVAVGRRLLARFGSIVPVQLRFTGQFQNGQHRDRAFRVEIENRPQSTIAARVWATLDGISPESDGIPIPRPLRMANGEMEEVIGIGGRSFVELFQVHEYESAETSGTLDPAIMVKRLRLHGKDESLCLLPYRNHTFRVCLHSEHAPVQSVHIRFNSRDGTLKAVEPKGRQARSSPTAIPDRPLSVDAQSVVHRIKPEEPIKPNAPVVFSATERLSIEHIPEQHQTKDPGGLIQLRIRVRNAKGTDPLHDVTVKIKSIVPNAGNRFRLPYTTQFNDKPLRMFESDKGKPLNPGDGIELIIAHKVPSHPDELFFQLEEGNCHVPRGKYTLTLSASASNSFAKEEAFIVSATSKNLTMVSAKQLEEQKRFEEALKRDPETEFVDFLNKQLEYYMEEPNIAERYRKVWVDLTATIPIYLGAAFGTEHRQQFDSAVERARANTADPFEVLFATCRLLRSQSRDRFSARLEKLRSQRDNGEITDAPPTAGESD